ncbi:hypothetical protein K457DRAFT_19753 [Linnemannia elongata AG-77]|uniref:Uncharacterized protein n=1 Tax=Linnemannia elongata AG-77 TaxID=1314771 RepID=A0A197JV37_9FUNG|nr:hypothetical protein K457DRAFT_19753 [Linnemannia elongata AG-77]
MTSIAKPSHKGVYPCAARSRVEPKNIGPQGLCQKVEAAGYFVYPARSMNQAIRGALKSLDGSILLAGLAQKDLGLDVLIRIRTNISFRYRRSPRFLQRWSLIRPLQLPNRPHPKILLHVDLRVTERSDDPKAIADVFADVEVLYGSWEESATSDNDIQDDVTSTRSPIDKPFEGYTR